MTSAAQFSDSRKLPELAGLLARAGQEATVLTLGADGSELFLASAQHVSWIGRLDFGSHRIAGREFRASPPGALEIENAIASIEDELAKVARQLPAASVLVVSSDCTDLFSANGTRGGEFSLSLEQIERRFQDLAAVVEGRTSSPRELSPGTPYVCTLLILRECMHHLRHTHLTLVASPPAPSGDPLPPG